MEELLLASHVALWVLMIVLYVAVFLLYRFFGEEMGVSQRRVQAQGPPLKSRPPNLRAEWSGNEAPGVVGEYVKARLLLFVRNRCPSCMKMRSKLAEIAAEFAHGIETIVLFHGKEVEMESYAAGCGADVRCATDDGISRQWNISASPFVVALDARGIVRMKGAVRSESQLREYYQSLVESHDNSARNALGQRGPDFQKT